MKLISGGQSGVDRAALDVAIGRGIAYGGWCPKGGWAEDFPEPPGLLAKYPELKETPLADPAQRTEWNVRDADACLIIVGDGGMAISEGTARAYAMARRYGKEVMIAEIGNDYAGLTYDALWLRVQDDDTLAGTALWLRVQHETFGDGLTLAIGGPRESEAPGIYARAKAFIHACMDVADSDDAVRHFGRPIYPLPNGDTPLISS